jgi:Ca-activated chloride channel family protein
MACVLSVQTGHAAGLLVADGGFGGVLAIEEHSVKVTVNGGIATTEVTQVFHNTENRLVEALYTFPVPRGATVANFSMWIDGKEMVGEVVEKKRAREIYETYKQQKRDPGLLEQTDHKTFELRVFPIAPNARPKIQIIYYQELDVDGDWATYVYPLATMASQRANRTVTGKFALSFDAKSEVPIVEVESPSHADDFVVAKHSAHYAQASLETSGADLGRDVVLAYRVARPRTGIDVVTTRPKGEDGYFYLTLTAGNDLAPHNAGMDYAFVLDVSGSMADDGKLRASRESVEAFVKGLGKDDRFDLITFNVVTASLFGQLRPATPENVSQGAAFLDSQRARGGTVLGPAITAAYRYRDPDRALNVVILSDGLTDQRDRAELLSLMQARPSNARVFCIGVGNDVDRPLLEQLAEDAGGLSAFISRADNFSRAAQAFRRKLLRPAATNVEIQFDGVEVYDLEPQKLPNLYYGMPVRVYGRYRNAATAKVKVRADLNGSEFRDSSSVVFPATGVETPEIERMWAFHRIQRLLKDADRTGSRDSVIGNIVQLGEAYSIVSEYTSFLVLENDAEYRRWKLERRNVLRIERDRTRQRTLDAQLASIRKGVPDELGPIDPGASKVPALSVAPAGATRPTAPAGINGGGAIDPMTALVALGLTAFALARRRHNREQEN